MGLIVCCKRSCCFPCFPVKTKNNITYPQTVEIPAPFEIHPSVSPKAAELLLGVIEVLMTRPLDYHQGIGYVKAECGTPCCILGHMYILQSGRPLQGAHFVGTDSGTAFGLTEDQSLSLYVSPFWPSPWKQKSDTDWVHPETAIARIEHFLRTGE